jgi:hypothetical protein
VIKRASGGGNWANDTYTRQFNVYTNQNADGSYRVVENFKNGHFITTQGTSPGACNASPGPTGNGNLVSGGVHGSFHGSYILTVNGGTFDPLATWNGVGGTAGFIAAAFGGAATYNTEDFYFYYHTGSPLACLSTWTNASTGNGGDIATIC